ncbi:MAG: glycosyltransferase [Opitutaceae bacterium]
MSNIPWDFVWQRHQTLASLFAREHEVAFLELPGVRRIGWRDLGRVARRGLALLRRTRAGTTTDGVQVLRPWVLPATNRLFCGWNRRVLLRTLGDWREGVETLVNYSPTPTALATAQIVRHRRAVYDCTDNWSAVPGVPESALRAEAEWLRRADLTVVPSRALETRHGNRARRLERLPHGALVDRFLPAAATRPEVEPITLLYYGHIHRQHLAFEAIAEIARLRPHWRILLVGPVKTPGLFPMNVELVGQQPHVALAGWVARAHVLLLPYVLNAYTECVLPAKTYECLATGRPIVAAPLPELVADFRATMSFAYSGSEYVSAVESALVEDTSEAAARRIALATRNSWEMRYHTLVGLLGGLAEGEVQS